MRGKPVDLTLLTIPRLKAYRKALYKQISPYEHCWCGFSDCDYELEHSRKDPRYIFLKEELERVNIELGKRQKAVYEEEQKKHWAEVSTLFHL